MNGSPETTCPSCHAPLDPDQPACRQCGWSRAQIREVTPGFFLASRYDIVRALGAGGMGVVFQAHDRLLKETVAIKVLRPEIAGTPEMAQRFLSEIKLARAVSHRNVCRIHEYGEDRGIRYISMAYVDGVDLRRILREKGPFPADQGYEIALRVAEGLQAIHDEGIIHRDLKTANVMMDRRGVVRLMDFGLAKQPTAGSTAGMTSAGQILGTPEYMSPEQIRGGKLDPRSDVYSLGILIYELFSGETPFRGDTPLATVLMHLSDPLPFDTPTPPPGLPQSVIPILRKALAKDASERYATAKDLAEDLERARRQAAATAPTVVPGMGDTKPGPGARLGPVEMPPDSGAPVRPDGPNTETNLLQDLVAPTRSPEPKRAAREPPAAPRAKSAGQPRKGLALSAAAVVILVAAVGWVAFRAARPTAGPTAPSQPPGSTAVPSIAPTTSVPAAGIPTPPPPTQAEAPRVPPGARATPSPGRREEVPAKALPSPKATPPVAVETAPTPRAAESRAPGRVDSLLTDAEKALVSQRFDAAIALYDEALKLDPLNQVARMGRATAVNARVTAQVAAGGRPDPGRLFQPGKTTAESAETKADPNLSQAFEAAPGMEVTRDTQASIPPGRIEFEAKPEALKAGDKYVLNAYFLNTGPAPIEMREMVITTTVNGRRASGPVGLATKTIGPGQKGLLVSLSDFMREDARTWSFEVVLRSVRGETYRNQLVWK